MRKEVILLELVILLFLFLWQINSGTYANFPEREKHLSDEILIRYKSDRVPFRRLRVPQGKTVEDLVSLYRKNPNVEYVEPNYIAYAFMIPNDPYYRYQWHLNNSVYGGINSENAWDVSKGNGVTVAVIDTGVTKGSDLASTCFVSGYDFVNHDSRPDDDNGHGTHVAGTIAQSTNNASGTAGVAFGACLMPIKVLNSNGSGTYGDIADGIRWAADSGAKVINMSLGGSAASETLKNALAYAYSKGVVIVAAVGNDGVRQIAYPAAYDDYVIAVGATQYDESLAPYSNFGPGLDLVAPGGNLNLDQNGDGYGDGVLQQTFQKSGWWSIRWGYYFMSGTSCASPHVAGVAALLIARGTTNPDEIRNVLQNTAEDHGPAGWDEKYGWGIVDATAALGALPPSPTATPTPAPPTVIPTATPTNTPIPQPTATLTPTTTPTNAPSPTATATPIPEEVKVILKTVDAVDLRPYQRYQVNAKIKNERQSAVMVIAQLQIKDPNGKPVAWPGMTDQEISLSGNEEKSIGWSDRVPGNAVSGDYLAIVSLLYQNTILDSKSASFRVTAWRWR